MAVKNTIYENLIAALKGIIAGQTYSETVKAADRLLIDSPAHNSQSPVVAIQEQAETLLSPGRDGNIWVLVLALRVTVDTSRDAAAEKLTNVVDDIRLMIDSVDLGSNVLRVRTLEVDSTYMEENDAGQVIGVEIFYWDSK